MELDKIYNMDCLEGMKQIPDGSVDAIICDLPYGTQKPVALIADLVRTYSNEGDTILDNCIGSGTTAVVCIKEKRHFIGFELNKDYYDKACKRTDAEQRQLTLF